MKKICLSLSLIIAAVAGYSQSNPVPVTSKQRVVRKYSNEFLAIGVGARALGMSNSLTSSVNDVTAGYWNPAGLMGIKTDLQVGLMHSEYFAGIAKYDFGAVAKPIDSVSAIGFSIIRFGVDNIPNTTELIDAQGNWDYNRITKFSASDYAFLFTYARKLGIEGLNVGGNVKVIHRRIGSFARAWGFGFDAGAQYSWKTWNFSAMARDVTTTFNAWSYSLDDKVKDVFEATGNEIPTQSSEVTLPRLITGVSKQTKLNDKFNLLAEINFDLTFDGQRNVLFVGEPLSLDPHMGFELGYGNFIFLRGGVGNIQKVSDIPIGGETEIEEWTFQPNIGIGLKIKSVHLDYALTDIGNQSDALYSNVFSLKFDLYKKGNKPYSEIN